VEVSGGYCWGFGEGWGVDGWIDGLTELMIFVGKKYMNADIVTLCYFLHVMKRL
jgi:hypothetical protein